MAISGQATFSGTDGYRRRQTCAVNHFRERQRLWMSSIGVGTYLGPVDEETDQLMHQAIVDAIANGINVIDTAINYRHQRSEQVVGRAIHQAIADGLATREELIVCSKGGFVPHPDRVEWFQATYVDPPDSSLCIADLAEQRHCMHPDYIRDQLDRSLANLGVDTIDIYYLHNPEAQLSDISSELFYEKLQAAFTVLEEAAEVGKIRAYGLATWDAFRVLPTHKAYIDLSKAQAIAQSVSLQQPHHFKFIQLPLNLLMLEGVTLPSQTVNGCQLTSLIAAQQLGITPIASAAIAQGGELDKMLSILNFDDSEVLSIGQRALQFTRSVSGISTALVGMKKPEHVAKNLELVTLEPLETVAIETLMKAGSNV